MGRVKSPGVFRCAAQQMREAVGARSLIFNTLLSVRKYNILLVVFFVCKLFFFLLLLLVKDHDKISFSSILNLATPKFGIFVEGK